MMSPDSSGEISFTAPEEIARIQEQLRRILSSRTFRTAQREKTLLRYLVERTIGGRGRELKEYTVGVEALGCGESFDPRRDTIVRVQARNARLRLSRYYADEGAHDPIRIELPKGGYAARFSEATQAAPDQRVPGGTARAARPLRVIRVAVMTASLLAVLLVSWFPYNRAVGRAQASDAASIAILPFGTMGAGEDSDIIADGLTEELIDSLARVPRLHVVARSSVFPYKAHTPDIRKVGRDLNVRNVLEGSVRIVGDRLRVSARLEDTINGFQLWSESYDGDLGDSVRAQGRISRAIAQSLGVQLSGASNIKSGVVPAPAAYADFLRGLHFLNRSTAENVRTSVNYFERAVAIDPNFAPAYRGLANAYSKLALFTSTPSLELIPRIRAAASKALTIDDTLGEAHLDLARVAGYEWEWPEAEQEYRRALELSPSSATVHHHYGYFLLQTGRVEEALAESRIALELDPISTTAGQFAGRLLYFARRNDDAIALLTKAVEANPSRGILHQTLGLAYLARPSTYAQGLAESVRARELMERDPLTTSQLGYAYALGGRRAEAHDLLAQLEKGSGGSVRPLAVARVYAGLDDRDEAFAWLSKAIDQRDVALFLQADPVYDRLRSDPRFLSLLRRVNLNGST
jgi:TolB-like protein/Tfp pilus assembly protein PilF